MYKIKRLTVLVICIVVLTGCWDKIDIEQRSFVYGIAIDLSDEHSDETPEIELTQQFIIPENITATGTSAGGTGPPYQNVTGTGHTVFEINRKIMRKENLKTDVSHLKVVLFSEELAKEPHLYEEFLDVFLREKEMRRGIKTAIASGKAQELLTVSPENEKIPAQYINGLLDNPQKFEVLDLVVIGDLQEKLFNKISFPLPLLTVKTENGEKLIDYEGIAAYNGHKRQVVGNIKGDASKGLSFIRGEKNTGTINISIDKGASTLEILKLKTRISMENKEIDQLKFTVKVDIEGSLAEQFGTANLQDPKVAQKFEEAFEKKAEMKMQKAIDQLQNDFQTDALNINSYLSRYHPKVWKEVKDDWDYGENYFSKSEITTNVNVTIGKPGSINRSTESGGK